MKSHAPLPNQLFPLVATTYAGLEPVLAEELRFLGASDVVPGRRAVEFRGDIALLQRACLSTRTAVRMLLGLRQFKAADQDELYREAAKIDWAAHLDPSTTFAVTAVGQHPAFNNSMFVAQKVKDAIADRLRAHYGERPNVDTRDPHVRIHVRLAQDGAAISLDASGEPLFRRGWREEQGAAPMSEALAAGIVALSKWDEKSTLVDPMTGSGTIAIEAALRARSVSSFAPTRRFGFERWKNFDSAAFAALRREAGIPTAGSMPRIVAADRDRKTLDMARRNAARAGVEEAIEFRHCRFEDLRVPGHPGLVLMNPPYDERLSVDDAKSFHRMLGDVLKQQFSGWRAGIFTGNLAAAKFIGLKTSARIPLFNGDIECRLLLFDLFQGSRKEHVGGG